MTANLLGPLGGSDSTKMKVWGRVALFHGHRPFFLRHNPPLEHPGVWAQSWPLVSLPSRSARTPQLCPPFLACPVWPPSTKVLSLSVLLVQILCILSKPGESKRHVDASQRRYVEFKKPDTKENLWVRFQFPEVLRQANLPSQVEIRAEVAPWWGRD